MSRCLTERELDVVATYIDAGTVREAARRLSIHPQTVKNTLNSARRRAGARNTVQLVYMLATGELDHEVEHEQW